MKMSNKIVFINKHSYFSSKESCGKNHIYEILFVIFFKTDKKIIIFHIVNKFLKIIFTKNK